MQVYSSLWPDVDGSFATYLSRKLFDPGHRPCFDIGKLGIMRALSSHQLSFMHHLELLDLPLQSQCTSCQGCNILGFPAAEPNVYAFQITSIVGDPRLDKLRSVCRASKPAHYHCDDDNQIPLAHYAIGPNFAMLVAILNLSN